MSLSAVTSMLTAAATGYTVYVGLASVNQVPCLVVEPLPISLEYNQSNHVESVSYAVTVIANYDQTKTDAENIQLHAGRVTSICSALMALPPTTGYLAYPTVGIDKELEYDRNPKDGESVMLGYFSISGGLS